MKSIYIDGQVEVELDRLSNELRVSHDETLKTATALLAYVQKERRAGKKFLTLSKDDIVAIDLREIIFRF